MEEANKDGGGRAVCGLQVVAVSGFLVEEIREMQKCCLGLCNACRDGVPMTLLKIKPGVPCGWLRMLYPGMYHADGDPVSRVIPHFRVQSVELTFVHLGSDIEKKESGPREEEDWGGIAMMDITTVTWPEGTRNILIYDFNRPVQEVVWPASLERLVFGRETYNNIFSGPPSGDFNQSVDGVNFPSGVREIFLGEAFDQSIDNVSWPEGLEKLSLPGFNQPIDKVHWPAGLKVLEFMPSWLVAKRKTGCSKPENDYRRSFNQPIHTGLPAGLHTLWLSDGFDQQIDNVVWPTGLVTIAFGYRFEEFFKGISWPSTLRKVFVRVKPLDYEEGQLPHGCNLVVDPELNFNTERDYYQSQYDSYEYHYRDETGYDY